MHGHAKCVEILIAAGADIHYAGETYSPVQWAAAYGRTDCLVILLAAGAGKASRCCEGKTLLMLAAQSDYVDCVELLIGAGCDLFAGWNGRTALALAQAAGAKKSYEFLNARMQVEREKKILSDVVSVAEMAASHKRL